jgi:hypothetical protein
MLSCSINSKGLSSRESKRNATPQSDDVADRQNGGTPSSDSLLNLAAATHTIDDDSFFDHLPVLLQEVVEKLGRLLDLEAESITAVGELDAAAATTATIPAILEAEPGLENVCPSLHLLLVEHI